MKITLLGCGNLIQAIFLGCYQSKVLEDFEIYTYTPSKEKAKKLASKIEANFVNSLDNIPESEIFIFGFKPQNYQSALSDYQKIIPSGAEIWSVLAGIDLNRLENDFKDRKILRIMPSICAEINQSINLFFSNHLFSEEAFEKIFSSVGMNFKTVSEQSLEEMTAVTASGPALIYRFLESMKLNLIKQGVGERESEELIKYLLKGSADLLDFKKDDLSTLRSKVTSRGGMTFEALKSYENNHLDEITEGALRAAFLRSQEMKNE